MLHKQTNSTNDLMKDSDLLCGDTITNYKTVQSFGHDKQFVKKYKSLIEPIANSNVRGHLIAGFVFGFSQFITYLIFSILFYAGGVIIENSQKEGNEPIDP